MQRPDLRVSYFLFFGIGIIAYSLLGYVFARHESLYLTGTYTLLFTAYLYVLFKQPNSNTLNGLVVAGVLFRFLFLFSFPSLSDDIFRFIWDGKLLNLDIHPFAELPSFYMQPGNEVRGLSQSLYDNLNSPNYFTIYPPFAQFIFWLSILFTNSVLGSTVVIRLLVLLAEVGSILIIRQLLIQYRLPAKRVLIYALNPLIIIELTGNLHFEAFMIFFLLLSIYCLHQNFIVKSAVFMACAVAAKLIPLMLLPLFMRRLKMKALIKYYLLTAIFICFLFFPLFNYDLITGLSNSIGLYFQKFEFNASVYYLIREIGFAVKGYNIIETSGKYLALFSFIGIMILSLIKSKRANVMEVMMWILTLYFFLATTVHPWYISTLLALGLFTSFRFTLLWSFLIFFTYIGYSIQGFQENYALIVLEYLLVITFIIYEIKRIVFDKIPKPIFG